MRVLVTLIATTCIGLIACSEKKAPEAEIPEVFVVTVQEQPYRPSRGFNGRIRSSSDVDIRAQVSGRLIAVHFKEGDEIKEGDPLFDIDPSAYQAALSQAAGELAKATAAETNAVKNFERGKKLIDDGYISDSEFDQLQARAMESSASVKSAEAAVEQAEVNLGYTKISAPQSGRIGRSVPSVGDIVGPNSGAMTTLVGQGGTDVVFQLPERLLVHLRRSEKIVTFNDIEVGLLLSDGSEYSETGNLSYFANRVDPTTGTVEVMAEMPNPDDFLRPGMFVRVALRLKEPVMGLMLPQAAVQADQQGTYVLAVDENNQVTRKNLVTGERFGENTLVNSGLEAGTRVIMRGLQKARVGDTVKALAYEPATAEHKGEASDQ
ncbi:membrane fusion protein, multidrug efflux system [Alteromonadaceae bacterium Bs31]|nr:membrane fusion protein, multidrug efflux system [Alteromonadaceae bacterium Bs31]